MIKFRCEKCQKKIGVPDEQAGRRIRCPQCRAVNVAPNLSDDSWVVLASDDEVNGPARELPFEIKRRMLGGADVVVYRCPSCDAELENEFEAMAGKPDQCPTCQKPHTVPGAARLERVNAERLVRIERRREEDARRAQAANLSAPVIPQDKSIFELTEDEFPLQCPYCRGEISGRAMKCMHCGEWLQDNPASATDISTDELVQVEGEYLSDRSSTGSITSLLVGIVVVLITAYAFNGVGGVLAAIGLIGVFGLGAKWLLFRQGHWSHIGSFGCVTIILLFLGYTLVVFIVSESAFDDMMNTLDSWVNLLKRWNDSSYTTKATFFIVALTISVAAGYVIHKFEKRR